MPRDPCWTIESAGLQRYESIESARLQRYESIERISCRLSGERVWLVSLNIVMRRISDQISLVLVLGLKHMIFVYYK